MSRDDRPVDSNAAPESPENDANPLFEQVPVSTGFAELLLEFTDLVAAQCGSSGDLMAGLTVLIELAGEDDVRELRQRAHDVVVERSGFYDDEIASLLAPRIDYQTAMLPLDTRAVIIRADPFTGATSAIALSDPRSGRNQFVLAASTWAAVP